MNEIAVTNGTAEIEATAITSDLYSKFVEYLGDKAPKTIETYTKSIRVFGNWLSYNGITQPKRADVIRYIHELEATHKPTTVQAYLASVRKFFKWLEVEGLYPNVAKDIQGAKLDKSPKKDYLTSRQVKKVLASAKQESVEGLRNYALLTLLFTCGLRTVEASRADIGDIRNAGDTRVIYVQGKGHKSKDAFVPLIPETEDAINAYLAARGATDPAEPLFVSLSNNSAGSRLSTRSISGIVKRAMQTAGYDSELLTAHSARHTAVTLSLIGGRSLEETQAFARHSKIEYTQIYAHNLQQEKNQCAATIGKAIFG